MHPILLNIRRLALYLLAWTPLWAIILYLLASMASLTWPQTLTLFLPLFVLYAFMCLASWYSCRATPLERSSFTRIALTHLFGGAILSTAWGWLARGYAYLLSSTDTFAGISQKAYAD